MEPLTVEPCDPADPAAVPTLRLGAGRHVVSAAPGIDTGVHLDRLVLASDAGGTAGSVADGRVTDRPTAPPTPHVEVVHDGRTRMRVHVEGADEPFWLVLGQSENAGWHATTSGAAVGPRRLVDGFANGWRVDPKSRSFDVVLQWTPQRNVWASLWISFAAGLACVGIMIFTWWRRRAALALVTAPDPADSRVALEWPGADELPALGGRVQVWVPIGCALVAGLIAAPWIGVLVGVVVAAALRWRTVRLFLAIAPAFLLASAGLYIAFAQVRYRTPPIFEWPTVFPRARTMAWLALVLLGAAVVVEIVRRRGLGRHGKAAEDRR